MLEACGNMPASEFRRAVEDSELQAQFFTPIELTDEEVAALATSWLTGYIRITAQLSDEARGLLFHLASSASLFSYNAGSESLAELRGRELARAIETAPNSAAVTFYPTFVHEYAQRVK